MSKEPVAESNRALHQGIRQDLEGIKYKMLNELFLQASNNNGVIDRNSPNFKTLRESFLNADPNDKKNEGKAVISVLGTEQTALKKLEKSGLLKDNPSLYAEIRAEINNVRVDLTKKLDSDKGVQELLADFLKQKSMEQMPFQVLVTENKGMYKAGDTRPMTNAEVRDFTDKLKPHVNFNDTNIRALATNGRVIDQGIGPIIQQVMIKEFGKPLPNNPNAYTLDATQVTPEKAKAFGVEVSQRVAEYSQQQARPYEIIEKVFQQAEENGTKFTPEQKNRITKTLVPALLSLGSQHLEKNMDTLADDLSNKLKDNRSLFSRIRGNFGITDSSLNKIATQVVKEQMPKSEKGSFEALQNQMMKHHTKTEDFNSKLQQFIMQNPKAQQLAVELKIDDKLSKAPLEKIAKLRLINPKAFDEAVFSKPAKNLPVVAEVMNSREVVEARAQFASSKTTSTSRAEDTAKMSAFKENQQPSKTLPPSRPAPLTPPELEKQKQENQSTGQAKASPPKPGTLGRAGGKKILEVFGQPLKGSDVRPTPTPPRPPAPPSRNKGKGDSGRGG